MKKMISLILVLIMVLSVCSCFAEETSTEYHTVVDMLGREVEVPVNVERIVPGWGLKYMIGLNVDEKFVSSTKDKLCLMIAPDLANNGSITRDGATSVEAIAELNPDVVIMKWNSKHIETLESLGIPTLGLMVESEDDLLYALNMFGEAFGAQERAEEMIAYYKELTQKAAELVADVPESEKPTAIFLGQYVGSTAPDTLLQGKTLEEAGAINPAAAEGRGELWPVVGMEKIMEWDPDYIFMANNLTSRDYTYESFVSDPANANLSAVKNGNVYESPAAIDLWLYPGTCIALGRLWMIHVMYPDRLSDAEFESIALDYYQKMYGLELTREEVGF